MRLLRRGHQRNARRDGSSIMNVAGEGPVTTMSMSIVPEHKKTRILWLT
jgi:hypothetical protein